ncbi:SRPBCC domain-containing protein (plasmid) [Tistrella mobilis]|uniref:SRPBCC family protein n=1 Tax=Tistrella mobilis TaxID=171437 RepID=UPI0035589764
MNVTDRIIRLKVDLAADRQTVWEALTGAQHVQAWWGRHVSLTPRAGGRLFVRGDGREQSRQVRGRVLRWSPPSALELAWADAAWPAETRVNIRLTPTPDGDTRLQLDHVGWSSFEDKARLHLMQAAERDWTARLERLEDYLRAGDIAGTVSQAQSGGARAW